MGKVAVATDAKQGAGRKVGAKRPRGSRSIGRNNALSRLAFSRKWLEDNDKERKPFNEELFSNIFGKENIEKLVGVVKKATETEVNESRRLLSDDYIYSVQITSQRAPHVPVHLSRILLPHSIETDDSDICLFVRDLKRGRKLDFEPTIKFYEQLLRSKKVTRPITIIPVNQLYNEYATFELRRKLTYLFDKFLVDKAVATHVNGFLGHKLLLKGRSAIPIDLDAEDIADEIDTNLRKVFYKHINNGIVQMVQVGRHSMSNEAIAENIIELFKQLGTLHPGGSNNIYKLHLKPNVNISVAVPIYINTEKAENLQPEKVITTDDTAVTDTDVVKVRVQAKSIIADNVVASDDEEADNIETNNQSNQKTDEVVKPTAAKVDDTQIQNLILTNLKKIIGSGDSSTPKKQNVANTGTANKTIARRQTTPRAVGGNPRGNGNLNRPATGGNRNDNSSNNRGNIGSMNRSYGGNSNAMLSDFGLNRNSNYLNDNMGGGGGNIGSNLSFGGNLGGSGGNMRGNSNFDNMMGMRGSLSNSNSDFSSDFGNIGARRSLGMGMGSNSSSLGLNGRGYNNNNSGMGMSGSSFGGGNMWGSSNNNSNGGGGGGYNNSWGNSSRF